MAAISRNADGGTWQLENDVVSVTVNPERGADILSLVWKATDTELLWRNPRTEGLPPKRGDYDLADSSYFDNYPGGIQELFPNAGASTEILGAALPFHGEALRRPWAAEVVGEELRCTTVLARYPFRMTKTFVLDGTVLRFRSRIENLSDLELPVHWGLHPAFNTQTVAAGGTVYGPFDAVTSHPEPFSSAQNHAPGTVTDAAPTAGGVGSFALAAGDSRAADLGYATVRDGWFGLRSPGTDLLATMTWPADVFPEVWIWQECHSPGGYPWWGTAHIVAVEPHTTSPFGPLAEETDALRIAGGETREAAFTLGVQPIEPTEVPVGMSADGIALLGEKQ